MTEGVLYRSLMGALPSFPPCEERWHLASLLAEAVRHELDDDVVRAVAETLALAPGSVERHLDRIGDRLAPPAGVAWFEWRTAALGLPEDGVERPELVGCLIARHPAPADAAVVLTAWRHADRDVNHARALLRWRFDAFDRAASAARSGRKPATAEATADASAGAAVSRILDLGHVFVPEGFRRELAGAGPAGTDVTALAEAKRSASSEHLFLIGALLMLASGAASSELKEASTAGGRPDGAAPDGFHLDAGGTLAWRRPRGPGLSRKAHRRAAPRLPPRLASSRPGRD